MEFSCEMVKVDLLGWRRCRIYETNIENELMQLPNNLRLKRSSRDTLCLLYLLLQIIFYNQLSHRKVRSQKVLLYYARSGAIKWFLYLNGIAFNVADLTTLHDRKCAKFSFEIFFKFQRTKLPLPKIYSKERN